MYFFLPICSFANSHPLATSHLSHSTYSGECKHVLPARQVKPLHLLKLLLLNIKTQLTTLRGYAIYPLPYTVYEALASLGLELMNSSRQIERFSVGPLGGKNMPNTMKKSHSCLTIL